MGPDRITVLKGIGWDHPRGFDCLVECSAAFHKVNPNINVVWERRSLRDFGEAPIGALANDYDLLIIDHPFSGKARSSACLLDLRQIVPDVIEDSLRDEVGTSARSYHFDGGVWALPTDAAAQIATYRPDLLVKGRVRVPENHEDVLKLAGALRREGLWIGVPSAPTDAICMVLSYAANLGFVVGELDGQFLDRAVLCQVLEILKQLVSLAHPISTTCNPIKMFETMCLQDEIAYVPLAFGYSNYARDGRKPLLLGADFAGPGPVPHAGALIGGAGCAVSAHCRDLDAAATYLRWLHRPDIMAGIYFEAGGQPGNRSAWLDKTVNRASNNFFSDTLNTVEQGYLRPRFDGFVPFMESAGERVSAFLREGRAVKDVADDLIDGYAQAYDYAQKVA